MEDVCAPFDQQLSPSFKEDPSLGSSFAARRGNSTNRLFNELNTSSGFHKPYSYDAMIAGALKSFWYCRVYLRIAYN